MGNLRQKYTTEEWYNELIHKKPKPKMKSTSTINTLVQHFISGEYGWSISEQFRDTFVDRNVFYKQNINALQYIVKSITYLRNSDLFNEKTLDELNDYYNDLNEYLTNG